MLPGVLMNVLLVIIDDMRPEIRSYGHPKAPATPHIDRLAATGRVFRRAYSQFPDCAPSRSSFLTGLRPDELGINTHYCSDPHRERERTKQVDAAPCHVRDAATGVTTMPQAFHDAGYITLSYGKVFHQGLDDDASWSTQEEFSDGYPRGQAKDQRWSQRAWHYEDWFEPVNANCSPFRHGALSPNETITHSTSVPSSLLPPRLSRQEGNGSTTTSYVIARRCMTFEHFASQKSRRANAKLEAMMHGNTDKATVKRTRMAAAAASAADFKKYVDHRTATQAALSIHALGAGLRSTRGLELAPVATSGAGGAREKISIRRIGAAVGGKDATTHEYRVGGRMRPWFIAVGFVRPHLPFNCPEIFWNRTRVPPPQSEMPPQSLGRGASVALKSVQVSRSAGFGEFGGFVSPNNLRMFNNNAVRFSKAASAVSSPKEDRHDDEAESRFFRNDTETIFSLARDSRRAYRACISFVDYEVGRLLTALEDTKQAHRTVVALIADHGFKLGEFGMWGKHSTLHTDVHVPFIVRHPHMIKRGEQSHVITELLDLYPTLAELSGLASQRRYWPPASAEKWPLSGRSRAAVVMGSKGLPTTLKLDLNSTAMTRNDSAVLQKHAIHRRLSRREHNAAKREQRRLDKRKLEASGEEEPVALAQYVTHHGAHKCMSYTAIFQRYSIIFWDKHDVAPHCNSTMQYVYDAHLIDERDEKEPTSHRLVPWLNKGRNGRLRTDFIVRGIPFHLEAKPNLTFSRSANAFAQPLKQETHQRADKAAMSEPADPRKRNFGSNLHDSNGRKKNAGRPKKQGSLASLVLRIAQGSI